MNEDLKLRQTAVKEIIARYQDAMEANAANKEVTDFLLESFRDRLDEQGLPLYGEEVLTAITLLESLVDITGESTLEDLQQGMLMMLLGLTGELQDRWKAKDKDFFIE